MAPTCFGAALAPGWQQEPGAGATILAGKVGNRQPSSSSEVELQDALLASWMGEEGRGGIPAIIEMALCTLGHGTASGGTSAAMVRQGLVHGSAYPSQ